MIVHAGATPVFVDVKDDDLNIDPELVARAVTPRTKAIMPVDLAGQPADLDPLLELGFPIIEDAAHAAESVYRGRKVGSIVDATCFSLYATKNIAAGEGGIVTTDRDDVAEAIRDRRLMRRGHGTLYDIGVPGYKANLSDVLASIALVQLAKVDAHREIRERHVALYDAAVADLDGITPLARDPRDVHALHLYVVRVDPERAGATRDEYQEALTDENIGTSIHFLPVHSALVLPGASPDLAARRRARRLRGALAAALAGALGRRRRGRDRGAPPRARALRWMRRSSRVLGTLIVTGLALAYILWKVDVGEALRILGDANWWWFFLSAAIMLVTVVPMAWRWQGCSTRTASTTACRG